MALTGDHLIEFGQLKERERVEKELNEMKLEIEEKEQELIEIRKQLEEALQMIRLLQNSNSALK